MPPRGHPRRPLFESRRPVPSTGPVDQSRRPVPSFELRRSASFELRPDPAIRCVRQWRLRGGPTWPAATGSFATGEFADAFPTPPRPPGRTPLHSDGTAIRSAATGRVDRRWRPESSPCGPLAQPWSSMLIREHARARMNTEEHPSSPALFFTGRFASRASPRSARRSPRGLIDMIERMGVIANPDFSLGPLLLNADYPTSRS